MTATLTPLRPQGTAPTAGGGSGREREGVTSAGQLAWPTLVGTVAAAAVFPVALVLTQSTLLAVAAAVAVLLASIAVASPFVALAVLGGLEVSQVGAVLLGYGVPSPLVLTQLLAFLALAFATVRGRLVLSWSPVLLGALLLVVTRALSVLTALEPDIALATVVDEVRDMLTLAVALVLLWITRAARGLARVLVLVLALMAAMTAVQEFVFANATDFGGFSRVLRNLDVGATTYRHSGPIGDSNFWGRVLVMFAPFAVALALASRTVWARLLWWGSSVSLLLGVWLTQSRGTFLSLAAAIAVLLVLAGWRYARWLALTPLLVALLLVLPATGERLGSLGDLAQTDTGGGDLSLLLRLASQEAALNMLNDRPLLGVGAGNYTPVADQYTGGLAFATSEEFDEPLAPHNAFLGFAAEGGWVGVLGFVFFLLTLFFCAGRAWLTAARRDPVGGPAGETRLLASACVAGLVGWTVASVFLHVAQFRTLLLFAALVAALDWLVRREAARGQPAHRPAWIDLRPGLALAAGALVTLAAVVQGPATQAVTSARSTLVASARESGVSWIDAYRLDLLSRGIVVATMSEVMTSPGVVNTAAEAAGISDEDRAELLVTANTTPRAASVELVVAGTDERAARALAATLPAVASAAVDELATPFLVRPTPPLTPVVTTVEQVRVRLVAGTLGAWLTVAAVVVWLQMNRRHRRLTASRGARG